MRTGEYKVGIHTMPQLHFAAHRKITGFVLENVEIGVHDKRPYPKDAFIATVIGPAFETYHPSGVGLSSKEFDNLLQTAYDLGVACAKNQIVVNTGAPMGIAALVAKGAKDTGGYVFGVSPVSSEKKHQQKWAEAWINREVLKELDPFSHQGIVVYSGMGFNSRNVLNVQISTQYVDYVNGNGIENSRQVGITISAGSGGDGTFHEGITGKEEQHTLGILLGYGGAAQDLELRYGTGGRKPYPHLVVGSDSAELVDAVLKHHVNRVNALINTTSPNLHIAFTSNFDKVVGQLETIILNSSHTSS